MVSFRGTGTKKKTFSPVLKISGQRQNHCPVMLKQTLFLSLKFSRQKIRTPIIS